MNGAFTLLQKATQDFINSSPGDLPVYVRRFTEAKRRPGSDARLSLGSKRRPGSDARLSHLALVV